MVSIIITLYNKEKSIRRAILSAINQIYRDIEIIVIDDCSTDDSKKICEEYNESIKLYSTEKNSGLPHSRRLGIEMAKGEFITFVDADDYLNHDAILECVNEHKRTNADIVQMKITRRISKLNIPIRFRSKYNKSMALDACLYNEQLFPVQCWGKLYKTELLKAVTLIKYDGFWGEDRIFNIPIFASNPNIAIAKKAKYNYTWGGATSSNFDINALQEYKKVYQIKHDWANVNGYEHHIPSMQNELLELLKYHVRQLINSCSMSDTDAINWLKNETSLPFWSSFNANLDATTIYNSENKSTTRIFKNQISKILTQF